MDEPAHGARNCLSHRPQVCITNGKLTGYVDRDLWEKIEAFQLPIYGYTAAEQDAAAWLALHPGVPYPAAPQPRAQELLDAIRAKIELNPAKSVIWEFRVTTAGNLHVLTLACMYDAGVADWRWRLAGEGE